MTTIWFPRSFSGVEKFFDLIKKEIPDAVVAFTHVNEYASGRSGSDIFEIEPHADDDLFMTWAASFMERNRVDIVIPTNRLLAWSKEAGRLVRAGVRVATCAKPENMAVLLDKGRTFKAMEKSGMKDVLPLHAVVCPGNPDEASAVINGFSGLPSGCYVKPVTGVGASGIFRVASGNLLEERMQAGDVSTVPPEVGTARVACGREPFMVMERLPGKEYSVDCFARAGNVVSRCVRLDIRVAQVVNPSLSPDVAKAIDKAIGECATLFSLDGAFNIQFREDLAGQPKFLEINPRMSAGAAKSALCGMNYPAMQCLGKPLAAAGAARDIVAGSTVAPVDFGVRAC